VAIGGSDGASKGFQTSPSSGSGTQSHKGDKHKHEGRRGFRETNMNGDRHDGIHSDKGDKHKHE
jgi:hypothetical protein